MIIATPGVAITLTIGPVLDADGVAVTDCVVGDFKISKNGGAPGALNGSATLTHRHTGHYSLALTVDDVDTVGTAEVTLDDTTNSCQPLRFSVGIPDDLLAYIQLMLRADAAIATDRADQLARINANQGSGAGSFDNEEAPTTELTADGVQAVWDALMSALTTTGSVGKLLADNLNATVSSRASQTSVDDVPTNSELTTALSGLATAANLATVAGYLDTEIAAILADTNELQTDWANGGRLDNILDARASQASVDGLNNLSADAVNAEVDTALSDWGKTDFSLASTGLNAIVPADPSAIPVLGTSSIVAWIGYIGAWTVNPVNSDDDSVVLRNSANNADLATHATSDDDTTFVNGAAS